MPTSFLSRRTLGVVIPAAVGWLGTYLATIVFRDYAAGTFLWLPFVMGALTTTIYAAGKTVTKKETLNTLFLMLAVFGIGIVAYAWEGLICLLMASPIVVGMAYLGYVVARSIVGLSRRQRMSVTILLVISVPLFMGFEHLSGIDTPERSVVTSIEIAAPPELVWKHVVSFSRLLEPTELLFKAGIAYPISATIDGNGVGAVRHCNFSTGSFVEPITTWDEPRRLAFSVDAQPEPMKELSPYDIHPAHLHDYFVSKHGEFRLTQLDNGHTLLEGTTWYTDKIKPALYWDLWSDYIVHSIHRRVLEHIKHETEAGVATR